MLEALFVWMGIGALVLLFFCATFGTVEEELGVIPSFDETVLILLFFIFVWPWCLKIGCENVEDFDL